ncbi:hypothetical protein [Halopelagius longus]|nr:hypothetical protein [Halopelagius longus]
MFTIVVARYTDTSTTAQQAATIVILPGLFVGFIPRPFTLAYPFLLVGFWLSQSRSTGMKIASSLLLVTLVLFHPFIALLTVSIVLVAMALKRSLQWRSFGQLSIGRPSVSIYILIAVGLELSYVLFVASGFSNNLIFGFSEMFFGPSVTGPGGPAGVGLIAEAFSDPKKFQELLLRSSFLLSLALASTIALVVQYRRRHFASESVVAVLSGLCVFGLFLILSFLPTGVGVTRLFILAPLFFLPLIPYAFSTQTPTRKFASIGLAVLIVTSGLLTGFLWPGIGGVEYSATEPQVVGVEWATEHVATEIVGTSMTHWIVVGKYGRETSTELSARDVNGMLATRLQNGSYSWEVTDRPPSALYVIDGAERARARQSASESDDRPIQCLHAFQLNQMKVYSNGDTNAFVLSQRPACGATS